MKYFLLTDTHFGAKNSSMTWWKSMNSFIYDQFIPHIQETQEDVCIIHLGDVFDSRSTINTFIAKGVRSIFETMSSLENVKQMYVIGGNHDYYSPENNVHCSLDIVLNNIPKLTLVTHHNLFCVDEGIAMLPWAEDINEIDKKFKYIFTHTDLITGSPKLSRPVFSGHIHQPYVRDNCRNLGSCFPLTFMDSNQARYYYLWDSETDKLEKFANKCSIRFWRARGVGELITMLPKISFDDYIELYIKRSEMASQADRIDKLNKEFKNVWIIPQPDEDVELEDVDCDIESIIESSIPDDLKEIFIKIKEKIVI